MSTLGIWSELLRRGVVSRMWEGRRNAGGWSEGVPGLWREGVADKLGQKRVLCVDQEWGGSSFV